MSKTSTPADVARRIELLRTVMEMQIPAPITGTLVLVDSSSQLFISPWTEVDLAELRQKMKDLVAEL